MVESMIKVAVVDDHALVRLGLAMLLKATGRHQVVAEATGSADLENLVRSAQADLVLLDLALDDSSGLEAASRLKRAMPAVRILVVTGNAYPGLVGSAFAAGADGFLVKHAQGSELLEAIDAVMQGERYISTYLEGHRSPATLTDSGRGLTERERQVITRIAAGDSNREIAMALNISLLTARKHRQNLMHKLDLHNAAEVTAFAIRTGLLKDAI